MNVSEELKRFIHVVIAIGVPAIACTGLYTLDYISLESSFMRALSILAYPTVLIGIIGLVMSVLSSHVTRGRYVAWSLVICAPDTIRTCDRLVRSLTKSKVII